MNYTPEEARIYNNFHMKYGKDEEVKKAEPFITEDEMEDLEQCCEEMLCVQCGLELDSRTDCECMCHQLV